MKGSTLDGMDSCSVLVAIFLTCVLPDRPDLTAQQEDVAAELKLLLEEAVEIGASAWPGVTLSGPDLVRHLARHLPKDAAPGKWLATRYIEDLYLACACLHRDRAALAAFDEQFVARVSSLLPQRTPGDLVDEVKQLLRTRLLTAAPGDTPKIGEYDGRGPLQGWVRTTAQRIAIDLNRQLGVDLNRRQYGAEPGDEGYDEALRLRGMMNQPELDHLQVLYGPKLTECFLESLRALAEEDRAMLQFYYMEGLKLTQIEKLLRIDHSTVSRRLKGARKELLQETKARLSERLRLSPEETESLIRVIRSKLEVSLSQVLGKKNQSGR